MPAHNILENTIIGFVADDELFYVTKDYEVANLTTGEIVSTGGPLVDKSTTVDAYASEVASHTHAVYGRDIAPGISMTVAKRNAKPNQNICIAVTTMRTGGPGNGWSIVQTLPQRHAVRLMHKWYIEHGLMDLYMRNKYTAFSGFQEWVCGKLIEFFHADNRLRWYTHAMDIDYEMETKSCGFTECLCDAKVPVCNYRNVIPNEYYDQFGLFDYVTRMKLWAEGKPKTEVEADMILHLKRLQIHDIELSELMVSLEATAQERLKREASLRSAARAIAVDAGYSPESEDEFQKRSDRQLMLNILCENIIAKKAKPSTNKKGSGIRWDGPVKYIDPYRGAEEGERLAAHEASLEE